MSDSESSDTNLEAESSNGDHLQETAHETGENKLEHETGSVEKDPTGKEPDGKKIEDPKPEVNHTKRSIKEKGDQKHESASAEKYPTGKDPDGKEMEDAKSEQNPIKQSTTEKGDQSQETETLDQLKKRLHYTDLALRSTQTSLKKTTEKLKTAKKELNDKGRELEKTNTELQSTKQNLNEAKNKIKTKAEDLQETKTKLVQLAKQVYNTNTELQSTQTSLKQNIENLETLEKQLSDKNEELKKTEEDLNETKNNLKKTTEDLQETRRKLAESERQYLLQGRAMTDSLSKWNMESTKREEAEKEAEELRTANAMANRNIGGLQREKVLLLWRLAFRLIYERQLKTKLRDVICAQTEELRSQFNTISRQHTAEQDRLHAVIEKQIHEQDAAKGEWQTQEAMLRDSIEELEVKNSEVEDQVAHCQLQVKEREGSVQIAKVWVQKLSEQCGANDMIREELNQTKTALARKDTLYQDTLEQLQREQRHAVQLQVDLDRERQLTAAMANAALQEATDVRRDHERIVVIKEENEKLENALRAAYRSNAEQCENLEKNKSERKRLVTELLSLRRQLTDMAKDKGRLQVKCNHLESELAQSPLNSTPNNTNSGHDLDPDTSLDPALYDLDQLSPVHH